MSGAAATATPPAEPLPRLREDLELREGAPSPAGDASWMIYDALRHRYIQIDRSTFAILSLWKAHATATALIAAVNSHLSVSLDPQEIERLSAFLEQNQLTENSAKSGWRQLSAGAQRQKHSAVMWAVHHYLFFKVPLFAPEAFLRRTVSAVLFLYRPRVQMFILAAGLVGLYLVSREWDAFVLEARGFATAGGAASVAVVLFGVKGLHELGHAYTAIRYGCRVPSIGLAFMMMAPMLYTDVTDAWQLQDRRQRLAIDAAGIAVEIGLACVATFIWVFLPEGATRHLAFLIATTSWVMSVAINLNPFMRFDGYYILSDLLRVENLQPRSFALGIWKLREFLFALKAPCPETMSIRLQRTLIAYAYGIWIYRLVLFTGIALLVYAYFFKVLGVVLFLFEVVYFIARPISDELAHWWILRSQILKARRFIGTAFCAVIVALVGVVPWPARVSIPAVIEGNTLVRIFPPHTARIVSISAVAGQHVNQGDVLIKLDAPDLTQEQDMARGRLAAVELRLGRQSADGEDRSARQVLESERAALKMQIVGLQAQRDELEVRAPVAGMIAEFSSSLRAGQWIGAKQQIALLDGSSGSKVQGYISEANLWRVSPGSVGRFVPDVPLENVVDVSLSPYGGMIEAHADQRQRLIPASAQYLVTMNATNARTPLRSTVRGTVHLDARAESLLAGTWRRVLKILIRESGI
jgi:putative peptide zinc metalloprotease protein